MAKKKDASINNDPLRSYVDAVVSSYNASKEADSSKVVTNKSLLESTSGELAAAQTDIINTRLSQYSSMLKNTGIQSSLLDKSSKSSESKSNNASTQQALATVAKDQYDGANLTARYANAQVNSADENGDTSTRTSAYSKSKQAAEAAREYKNYYQLLQARANRARQEILNQAVQDANKAIVESVNGGDAVTTSGTTDRIAQNASGYRRYLDGAIKSATGDKKIYFQAQADYADDVLKAIDEDSRRQVQYDSYSDTALNDQVRGARLTAELRGDEQSQIDYEELEQARADRILKNALERYSKAVAGSNATVYAQDNIFGTITSGQTETVKHTIGYDTSKLDIKIDDAVRSGDTRAEKELRAAKNRIETAYTETSIEYGGAGYLSNVQQILLDQLQGAKRTRDARLKSGDTDGAAIEQAVIDAYQVEYDNVTNAINNGLSALDGIGAPSLGTDSDQDDIIIKDAHEKMASDNPYIAAEGLDELAACLERSTDSVRSNEIYSYISQWAKENASEDLEDEIDTRIAALVAHGEGETGVSEFYDSIYNPDAGHSWAFREDDDAMRKVEYLTDIKSIVNFYSSLRNQYAQYVGDDLNDFCRTFLDDYAEYQSAQGSVTDAYKELDAAIASGDENRIRAAQANIEPTKNAAQSTIDTFNKKYHNWTMADVKHINMSVDALALANKALGASGSVDDWEKVDVPDWKPKVRESLENRLYKVGFITTGGSDPAKGGIDGIAYSEYMKDDEKRVLAYYLSNGDTQSAQRYFSGIELNLEARMQQSVIEAAHEHPLMGLTMDAAWNAGMSIGVNGGISANMLLSGYTALETVLDAYKNGGSTYGFGTTLVGGGISSTRTGTTSGLTNVFLDKRTKEILARMSSQEVIDLYFDFDDEGMDRVAQEYGYNTYDEMKDAMDTKQNHAAFKAGTLVSIIENFSREATFNIGMRDAAKAMSSLGLSAESIKTAVEAEGMFGLCSMGAGVASETIQQKLNEGASLGQALSYGAVCGLMEVVSERIGMDAIIEGSIGSLGKNTARVLGGVDATTGGVKRLAVRNAVLRVSGLAETGFAEGCEEIVSGVADAYADIIINGQDSEFAVSYRKYLSDGLDAQEAYEKAKLDVCSGIIQDFLGGFVSGLAFGGFSTVSNSVRDYALGAYLNEDTYKAENMIDMAIETMSEDSDSHRIAVALSEEINRNNGAYNISNSKIASLARAIDSDISELKAIKLSPETTSVSMTSGTTMSRAMEMYIANGAFGTSQAEYSALAKANQVLADIATGREISDNDIRALRVIDSADGNAYSVRAGDSAKKLLSNFLGYEIERGSIDEVRFAIQQYNDAKAAIEKLTPVRDYIRDASGEAWVNSAKDRRAADVESEMPTATAYVEQMDQDARDSAREDARTEQNAEFQAQRGMQDIENRTAENLARKAATRTAGLNAYKEAVKSSAKGAALTDDQISNSFNEAVSLAQKSETGHVIRGVSGNKLVAIDKDGRVSPITRGSIIDELREGGYDLSDEEISAVADELINQAKNGMFDMSSSSIKDIAEQVRRETGRDIGNVNRFSEERPNRTVERMVNLLKPIIKTFSAIEDIVVDYTMKTPSAEDAIDANGFISWNDDHTKRIIHINGNLGAFFHWTEKNGGTLHDTYEYYTTSKMTVFTIAHELGHAMNDSDRYKFKQLYMKMRGLSEADWQAFVDDHKDMYATDYEEEAYCDAIGIVLADSKMLQQLAGAKWSGSMLDRAITSITKIGDSIRKNLPAVRKSSKNRKNAIIKATDAMHAGELSIELNLRQAIGQNLTDDQKTALKKADETIGVKDKWDELIAQCETNIDEIDLLKRQLKNKLKAMNGKGKKNKGAKVSRAELRAKIAECEAQIEAYRQQIEDAIEARDGRAIENADTQYSKNKGITDISQIDTSGYTADMLKKFKWNESQTEVGSRLKTLGNSNIERYKKVNGDPVGKQVGDQVYFHKMYAEDVVPSDDLEAALRLLKENYPDFEYNCMMYETGKDKKTGEPFRRLRFDESPDFDTAREPITGRNISVNISTGELKEGRPSQSYNIWHHKWMWVRNDYTGFDVAESWNWSRTWLSAIYNDGTKEANNGRANGSGKGTALWNAQLRHFGLNDDDTGSAMPESATRFSLNKVAPIVPSSDAWEPGHTEQWFRDNGLPIYADVPEEQSKAAQEYMDKKSGGHGTQRKNTEKTYRQVFDAIKYDHPDDWKSLRILDASSGLGLGTLAGREAGFNVEDIEPYPNKEQYMGGNAMPMYMDYSDLVSKVQSGEIEGYDYIISNAVLNVLAQDVRDNLIVAMGQLLKPGGQMYINVIKYDYDGAKIAKPYIEYTDKGVPTGYLLTQEGNYDASAGPIRGHEMFVWGSNSAQKVYHVDELVAYVLDALGDDYTAANSKTNAGNKGNPYYKKPGMTSILVNKSEDAAPITKFSMNKSIESVGSLIAQHNLSEENLIKTMNLGAFPAPSIAVSKSTYASPHYKLSPITVLFNKTTVDPEYDDRNKLYSDDAGTATIGEDTTGMKPDKVVSRMFDGYSGNYYGAYPYRNIDEAHENEWRLSDKDNGVFIDSELETAFGTVCEDNGIEDISWDIISEIHDEFESGEGSNGLSDSIGKMVAIAGRMFESEGHSLTEKEKNLIEDAIRNGLTESSTQYFEAKPRRAVGFDEVVAIIAPGNISDELRNLLATNGISMYDYDGSNEDRLRVINYVADSTGTRFSRNRKAGADYHGQEHTSEETSLNQVAATFSKIQFSADDRVLDWGGGRYDTAKQTMESVYPGIKFEVHDPFNRTPEHNNRVLAEFRENPATILTVNNVLNVIDSDESIDAVIAESKKYLAPGGKAYFLIYEGDGTGERRETSKGWQNNMKTSEYKPLIKKHYKDADVRYGVIVASDESTVVQKADNDTAKLIRDTGKSFKQDNLYMKDSKFSKNKAIDTDYFAAVEEATKTKDYTAVNAMVKEAANDAGYTVEAWHGASKVKGSDERFTVFQTNPGTSNIGSHFGPRTIARAFFANESAVDESMYHVYLRLKNPWKGFDAFADDNRWIAEDAYNVAKSIGTQEAMDMVQWAIDRYAEPTSDGDYEFVGNDEYDQIDDTRLYQTYRDLLGLGKYDGVAYENLYERTVDGDNTCYVVLDPENIKSAEPIERGADGEIIPLSERFNPEKDDIRYSKNKSFGPNPVPTAEFATASLSTIISNAGSKVDAASVSGDFSKIVTKADANAFVNGNSQNQAYNRMNERAKALAQKIYDGIPNKRKSDTSVDDIALQIMDDTVLYIIDNTKTGDPNSYYGKMYESIFRRAFRAVETGVPMGSVFSGTGTLEAAMQAVINSVFANEYDADLASGYISNFGAAAIADNAIDEKTGKPMYESTGYPIKDLAKIDIKAEVSNGHIIMIGDVRKVGENAKNLPDVFWFHCSPVCHNFSAAKNNAEETELDMDTAAACAKAIREKRFPVVTVENVVRYKKSDSLKLITDALNECGYTWDIVVVKDSDYGGATKRQRMFVRAALDGTLPPMPAYVSEHQNWWDTIKDHAPNMEEWHTTDKLLERFERERKKARYANHPISLNPNEIDKPMLVYGGTKDFGLTIAWADDIFPTITANNNDGFVVVPPAYSPDGEGHLLKLRAEELKLIQGLPESFVLPETETDGVMVVGNGISPRITCAVVSSMLYDKFIDPVATQTVSQQIDEKYLEAVDSHDETEYTRLFNEYVLAQADKNIVPVAYAAEMKNKTTRDIVAKLRSGDQDTINQCAKEMVQTLKSIGAASDKYVLVPMPSHTGQATNTLALANAISEITGQQVRDVISGMSRKQTHKPGKSALNRRSAQYGMENVVDDSSSEMGMYAAQFAAGAKIPIIIDDVIYRGTTAQAGIQAMQNGVRGGIVVAYANSTPSKKVSEKKGNATYYPIKSAAPVTYDDAGRPIPLSQRFDLSVNDVRYSRNREITEVTDTLHGDSTVLWGKTSDSYLESSEGKKQAKVPCTYAVVPLSDLITSTDQYGYQNPDYPGDRIQPRTVSRNGVSAEAAYNELANALEPELVAGMDKNLATGMPVVRPDGVVISGNKRINALRVYYGKDHGGQPYKDFIGNAGLLSYLGFTKTEMPDQPVMVRVVQGAQDWQRLSDIANASATDVYSGAEQALRDAAAMGDDLPDIVVSSTGDYNTAANEAFIRSFVSDVATESERSSLLQKDAEGRETYKLTVNGQTRLVNAVLAKAFGNDALMQKIADDPDNNIKSIASGVAAVAGRIVEIRQWMADSEIATTLPDDIVRAIELYSTAKETVTGSDKVDSYLGNISFHTPYTSTQIKLARIFEANPYANRIRRFFQIVADYMNLERNANDEIDGQFGGLWGDEITEETEVVIEDHTDDILAKSVAQYNREQDERAKPIHIEYEEGEVRDPILDSDVSHEELKEPERVVRRPRVDRTVDDVMGDSEGQEMTSVADRLAKQAAEARAKAEAAARTAAALEEQAKREEKKNKRDAARKKRQEAESIRSEQSGAELEAQDDQTTIEEALAAEGVGQDTPAESAEKWAASRKQTKNNQKALAERHFDELTSQERLNLVVKNMLNREGKVGRIVPNQDNTFVDMGFMSELKMREEYQHAQIPNDASVKTAMDRIDTDAEGWVKRLIGLDAKDWTPEDVDTAFILAVSLGEDATHAYASWDQRDQMLHSLAGALTHGGQVLQAAWKYSRTGIGQAVKAIQQMDEYVIDAKGRSKRIDQLNEQYEREVARLQQAEDKKRDLIKQQRELSRRLNDLKKRIEDTLSGNAAIAADIQRMNEEGDTVYKQTLEAMKRYDEVKAAYDEISRDLYNARMEFTRVRTQNVNLSKENQKLIQQYAETMTQIKNALQEIEEAKTGIKDTTTLINEIAKGANIEDILRNLTEQVNRLNILNQERAALILKLRDASKDFKKKGRAKLTGSALDDTVMMELDKLMGAVRTSDEKSRLIQSIMDYGKMIDAWNSMDKNAMVEAIKQMAETRGMKPGRMWERIARQQSEQYLKEYAFASLMAIPSDYEKTAVQRFVSGAGLATFQYLAQLLNPRTWERNLWSNTVFYAVNGMAKNFSSVVDAGLGLMTGQRTVAATHWSTINKRLARMDAAIQSYQNIVDNGGVLNAKQQYEYNNLITSYDSLSELAKMTGDTGDMGRIGGLKRRAGRAFMEVRLDVTTGFSDEKYNDEAKAGGVDTVKNAAASFRNMFTGKNTGDPYSMSSSESMYERIKDWNDSPQTWRRQFKVCQAGIAGGVARFLSHLEMVNGYALNVSDEIFKGAIFQGSINSYAALVASNSMKYEDAVKFAIEDMLYATFQDETKMGKVLSGLHDVLNIFGIGDNGNGAHTFGLGDVVVKYRTVPGALLTRAIEFSPAGAMYGVLMMGKMATEGIKNGTVSAETQRKAALAIGRAIPGSMIAAMAVVLFMHGIIKRPDDEDDKDAAAQMRAEGITGTMINLRGLTEYIESGFNEEYMCDWNYDDNLYDIGWMDPVGSNVTMGMLLGRAIKEDPEGWNATLGAICSTTAIANVQMTGAAFSDLSMMDTINDLIYVVSSQYKDRSTMEKFWGGAFSVATSAVTSFQPAVLRQIAKGLDNSYRDIYAAGKYSERGGDGFYEGFGSGFQSMVYSVEQNIPGFNVTMPDGTVKSFGRYAVPEKQDNYGNTKTYSPEDSAHIGNLYYRNMVNSFLIAGTLNRYTRTDFSKAIQELYEASGDASVIPDRNAPKSISANGYKISLSEDQRTAYKAQLDDVYEPIALEIMNSQEYAQASATERVAMLADAKSYAEYKVKQDIWAVSDERTIEMNSVLSSDAYLNGTADERKDLINDVDMLSSEWSKLDDVMSLSGKSWSESKQIISDLSAFKSDSYIDENDVRHTIDGSEMDKKLAYINQIDGLSDAQKMALTDRLVGSSTYEKMQTVMDATGTINYDDAVNIVSKYHEVSNLSKDELAGITAVDRGTYWDRALYDMGYDSAEREVIEEEYMMRLSMPQTVSSALSGLQEHGVDYDNAYKIAESWSSLEPTGGSKTVSESQKCDAVDSLYKSGDISGSDLLGAYRQITNDTSVINLMDDSTSGKLLRLAASTGNRSYATKETPDTFKITDGGTEYVMTDSAKSVYATTWAKTITSFSQSTLKNDTYKTYSENIATQAALFEAAQRNGQAPDIDDSKFNAFQNASGAAELGMSYEDFVVLYKDCDETTSDKNANGNPISNSRKKKIVAKLQAAGLTSAQYNYMYSLFYGK